ncbi:hypothetical protein BLNAU_6834 [Blattamonas nauphoetae]|uniref:Uncharacterized protein n=1 Tax=Blattamonas nauphoetae TaxID=2049346 RepID=A0ABQ9Y332_9EUKA|nr:hypothetical protein BLNAU_6834 [Blattamonas nauphoetae]
MVWFAGTIGILSRQSRSTVATLSFTFADTLEHKHLPLTLRILDLPSPLTPSHFLCLSLTTHTLPLPSASPLATLCVAHVVNCSS